MTIDGDTRYNPDTERWEQYHEPPGTWQPVEADFGQLDRPADLQVEFDAGDPPINGHRPDAPL